MSPPSRNARFRGRMRCFARVSLERATIEGRLKNRPSSFSILRFVYVGLGDGDAYGVGEGDGEIGGAGEIAIC